MRRANFKTSPRMLLISVGRLAGRRALTQLTPCCSRFNHNSSASSENDDQNKAPAEDSESLDDDRQHVFRAYNVITQAKSVVKLEYSQKSIKRFRRDYTLPPEAMVGLRNAVLESDLPAKVLQHDADQLLQQLDQRRFPASPEAVKETRDELKAKLQEDEPHNDIELGDGPIADKVKQAQEYSLRRKVDRIMKKTHFNWKPLNFHNQQTALAYALCRLAPNYAEVARVLEEFNRIPDYVPKSVLDYGSGVGGAFWAIFQKWGNQVESYTSVDVSDIMTQLSMDIMRKYSPVLDTESASPLLHKSSSFRRHLVPSPSATYDMVIVHRTLCELGSRQSRLELIDTLWKRTNKYLVLIDSGLVDSFRTILECRDFLLTEGVHLADNIIPYLQQNNAWTPLIESPLKDKEMSRLEKYALISEQLPHLKLPTVVEPATVFAPCPHDLGCPMVSTMDSCTFDVHYRPVRADCKRYKQERDDGRMATRMSFVIMEKGLRQPGPETIRLIENRTRNRHNVCDVCTAYKGLQRFTVAKSDGALFKMIKARNQGEPLPLTMNVLESNELDFDINEEPNSEGGEFESSDKNPKNSKK
ncbi:hypothetical protein WR25_04226 [Diploscapter pachys]|uniref:Methyltransferase domain-containing protein n=1 Tax=Diploscapter pachys TaxID=2018661 RepID=A0A2A2K1C0_9BILA|nr:hypothetical protein WR25_04226 [Diploscapter pachys]